MTAFLFVDRLVASFLKIHLLKPSSISIFMKVVDDQGQEVELHQEGNLAIRVAPVRPVGLFTHYVVSTYALSSLYPASCM